jgi:hypothetical protein
LRRGGWLSIAGITQPRSRAAALLPELTQDRPNLSNRDQVISSRMNNVQHIRPVAAPIAQESA